jgi:unsaturated rhamnogalacturonyl hydrolase
MMRLLRQAGIALANLLIPNGLSGLLSHIYQDGRLGCIQPVGAAPGDFTAASSYVFGTGAFLLAGSEVYRLAR